MLIDLDNGQSRFQGKTASPQAEPFEVSAYITGAGPASRTINTSAISAAHPDPVAQHAPPAANPYAVPAAFGRPNNLGDVPLIDLSDSFALLSLCYKNLCTRL
jgi:hypothetical protein